MTPEVVLRASGHVERFTDFMVTDAVTHDCHRADHLLEAALEARLADAAAPPPAAEREVRPRALPPAARMSAGEYRTRSESAAASPEGGL